jgi:Bacterial EndoU nuclease
LSARYPRSLIWLVLLLFLWAGCAGRCEALALSGKWTATDPPINFVHIEFGEINRRGEAVGFHHRPGGVDPPGARVLKVVQPPDANGVFRAQVMLLDSATGTWVRKKAPSTFYPDEMTPDEVFELILAAFRNAGRRNDGHFVGSSGRGFAIEGWYQGGRINAAYPLRGP